MAELLKFRRLSASARTYTIAAAFHALAAAPTLAQEAESEKEQIQRWLAYYKQIAEGYDFRIETDPDATLVKSSKPLMTYSIPEERVHGAFWVWTSKGRPEVIGSIWSGDPVGRGFHNVVHEFHSLSLVPLEPIQVGGARWEPEEGIELKEIPAAPPPSEGEKLRLAQMRTLARRFTGYSTPHGTELTLRTQSQPLYRYESEAPEVLDGALFAMFAGWDPDVILLVEARPTQQGMRWHYGLGRFNATPVRVEYQGDEVWHADNVDMGEATGAFYAGVVETRRVSDIPEAAED
jgi:hypothetical protein